LGGQGSCRAGSPEAAEAWREAGASTLQSAGRAPAAWRWNHGVSDLRDAGKSRPGKTQGRGRRAGNAEQDRLPGVRVRNERPLRQSDRCICRQAANVSRPLRQGVGRRLAAAFPGSGYHEVIKSAFFKFYRTEPDGKRVVYYTIKLSDGKMVRLHQFVATAARQGLVLDKSAAHELEEVALLFQKMEVEYKMAKTMAAENWPAQLTGKRAQRTSVGRIKEKTNGRPAVI